MSDPDHITDDEQRVLIDLAHRGFAVVVFNPTELDGADSVRVEDRLVETGWEIIDALKGM